MNCPQCQSKLLVEVFGTSNPIRCASCGGISMPVNQQASEVHRDSRRSLWLGVASIVLLFLTGLPAVWYGVRSLLKMRFVRSERGDRRAATIGTALGLIFGIFGLAFVSVAAGIALTVVMVQKDIESVPSVLQRMDQIPGSIGTLEVPDGFRLHEATRLPSNHREIIWQDGSDAKDMEARMLLVKTPESSDDDLNADVSESQFRLYEGIEVEPDSQRVKTLSWEFAGANRDVTRTTQSVKDADFVSVLYSATAKDDDGDKVIALSVVVREPGKYTEDDVEKIFESFEEK